MSTFTPPAPKPGKRSVLFKYPRARRWSANIVLPNGHSEVLDEKTLGSTKDINVARARAMHQLAALQRKFNIESQTKKDARERGGGELRPPGTPGRKPGRPRAEPNGLPPQASPGLSQWSPIIRRYVRGFRQIEELVIIGGDDPVDFATQVRAIVLQSLMGRGKRMDEPE